jgi:hypothetical protein
MQKIILYSVIVLVAFVTKLNAQEAAAVDPSAGWSPRQTVAGSYEMQIQNVTSGERQNVSTIKSLEKKVEGFGNIMKSIKPDLYLGKTVRLTGYIKSENVKSWAGLWMRTDYYKSKVLSFDNMQNRGIKGTTDWAKYEIVLFVPVDATVISYGALLDGTGQIWFDDMKLEIVEDTIPETGRIKGREAKHISFETRAEAIASQMEMITNEEKIALKEEVKAIDDQMESGKISKEKADELKMAIATERAKNIEAKIAIEEEKLAQLVKDKVEGKFVEDTSKSKKGGTRIVMGGSSDNIGENQTEINLSSFKIYNGKKDYIEKQSKRTTSQFVFAAGLNNVVTEGESLKNSDFKVWGSHFYELGLTYNSRILKNHNLLHAKYGLSVMYNNLRATDNRYFVKTGNETYLQTASIDLDESRFRNVFLVAPVHLEFDFSGKKIDKEGNSYFKTHDSFRLGIGGYGGVRVKSKQILKYEENGHNVKNKEKGDFNVSDFTYGLSGYIGYGQTSLYVKYDINPMFKNNNIDQNNVSLGIRFDFN